MASSFAKASSNSALVQGSVPGSSMPARRRARVRAGRRQARPRVFNGLAARVHDDGHRRRIRGRRLLPISHALPHQPVDRNQGRCLTLHCSAMHLSIELGADPALWFGTAMRSHVTRRGASYPVRQRVSQDARTFRQSDLPQTYARCWQSAFGRECLLLQHAPEFQRGRV